MSKKKTFITDKATEEFVLSSDHKATVINTYQSHKNGNLKFNIFHKGTATDAITQDRTNVVAESITALNEQVPGPINRDVIIQLYGPGGNLTIEYTKN
jgi:hypothetical protein